MLDTKNVMLDTKNIRTRLDAIRVDMDALNDKKSGILKAWEGEKLRQNDPEMEKPLELVQINKQLGRLYGQRDALLEGHPELKAEYGVSAKRARPGKSPLGQSVKRTAADESQKKARYLANKEAKREENRERARRAGAGRGGKK